MESSKRETEFVGNPTPQQSLTNSFIDGLYKKLSEYYPRIHDTTHYNSFSHYNKWLYHNEKYNDPLTNLDGEIKTIGQLKSISGKGRIRRLSFDASEWPISKKIAAINKSKELPSKSDVNNVEGIELRYMMKEASSIMRALITDMKYTQSQTQTDKSIENSLQELSSFDKGLKTLRVQLKLAVTKKLNLEEVIKKKKEKLAEI